MNIKKDDLPYTIAYILLKELPDKKRNIHTVEEVLAKVKNIISEVPLEMSKQ